MIHKMRIIINNYLNIFCNRFIIALLRQIFDVIKNDFAKRDSCKTRLFLLLVILSRSIERSEVASEKSL